MNRKHSNLSVHKEIDVQINDGSLCYNYIVFFYTLLRIEGRAVKPMLPQTRKYLNKSGRNRRSASGIVIDAVKMQLTEGNYSVGDRIPNEFEIAESLEVSRGSVREAMKILSAMGVVEIRRGDGTYISDKIGPSLIEQMMLQLVKRDRDSDELAQIREIIERGIVQLSIQNATEEQIQALRDVWERQKKEVEEKRFDHNHLISSELAFHEAMVDCTNNELLKLLYMYILELFLPERYQYKDCDYEEHMHIAVRVHAPVIEAIANRDPEAGDAAIRETTYQWVRLTDKNE